MSTFLTSVMLELATSPKPSFLPLRDSSIEQTRPACTKVASTDVGVAPSVRIRLVLVVVLENEDSEVSTNFRLTFLLPGVDTEMDEEGLATEGILVPLPSLALEGEDKDSRRGFLGAGEWLRSFGRDSEGGLFLLSVVTLLLLLSALAFS